MVGTATFSTVLMAECAQFAVDRRVPIGQVFTAPMQGKYYILKLQERSDRDSFVKYRPECTIAGKGVLRWRIVVRGVAALHDFLQQD